MLKRSTEMSHKSVMEALGAIPGMGSLTGVPTTATAGKVDPKSLRIDETNANAARITGMQLDECACEGDEVVAEADEEEVTEEEDEVTEGDTTLASTDDDAPVDMATESASFESNDVRDWESLKQNAEELLPLAKRLMSDVKKFYREAAKRDINELPSQGNVESGVLADIQALMNMTLEAEQRIDELEAGED